MGVHFQSVAPVNPSGKPGWTGLDIYFQRVANPPASDKGVEDLRRGLELAVRKLHLAARTEDQFMPIFNLILNAAGSSLIAAGGMVSDGVDQLDYIKLEILKLARGRRAAYFAKLLAIGMATSVVGFLLYLAVYFVPPYFMESQSDSFKFYRDSLQWLLPSCLILPGASLGVVFIGFSTNRLMSYDGVGRLDQYDFLPWERFAWVVLLSYVLLVALWYHAFVLGVGTAVLNEVTNDPKYGLFIGVVCGISEALVAELLVTRLRPAAQNRGTN